MHFGQCQQSLCRGQRRFFAIASTQISAQISAQFSIERRICVLKRGTAQNATHNKGDHLGIQQILKLAQRQKSERIF